MSSGITLKVAALTGNAPMQGLTDAQYGQAVKWAMADVVAPPDPSWTAAVTNQYYLDAAAVWLKLQLQQKAAKGRRKAQEAERAALDAAAELDTQM